MSFRAVGEMVAIAEAERMIRFHEGLEEAADFCGRLLVKTAQDGMDAAGSPSAAGGYPGVRTGRFRAGVTYNVTDNALYFMARGKGKKGAPLAGFLEDGTKKMAKRPVIKLAADEVEQQVKSILGTSVAGRIR